MRTHAPDVAPPGRRPKSMASPRVVVVIPCKNEEATLAACLRALGSQAPRPHILVVDNGSTDRSMVIARRMADQVEQRLGGTIAAVRNHGAAVAPRAEYLAFLDADCIPGPGWIAAALEQLTAAALVSGPVLAPREATWVARRWAAMADEHSGDDANAGASNMVIRRAFFDELGGFREDLKTYEDWDLCLRVKAAGGRVRMAPDVQVVHHGFPGTLREFVRSERWHASAAQWFRWMTPRSRAVVVGANAWAALGAVAGALTLRRSRAAAPIATGWATTGLAGVAVVGARGGAPRYAPADAVLILLWALARTSARWGRCG
jgi:GT2 family glycosyltransferase